jgi:hypothetical protein
MNTDYRKVTTCGFTAYCDALIARKIEPGYQDGTQFYQTEFRAFLLSLVGTASYIKTISAQVITGKELYFEEERKQISCCFYSRDQKTGENIKTVRVRKIGETVNKIIVHRFLYEESDRAAIVFGRDQLLVKERAFRRLDACTAIPLKQQWSEWLWDEVLQPEQLFSYGGSDLRFAYLISWPAEEELQEMVLDAINLKFLS